MENLHKYRARIIKEFTETNNWLLPKRRRILVGWLYEVLNDEEFVYITPEMIERAFIIFVRVFPKLYTINEVKKYQLVIVTALIIAYKHDNDDDYEISSPEIFSLCDNAYTNDEFVLCEVNILKALDWTMPVTLYNYTSMLVCSSDNITIDATNKEYFKTLNMLTMKIMLIHDMYIGLILRDLDGLISALLLMTGYLTIGVNVAVVSEEQNKKKEDIKRIKRALVDLNSLVGTGITLENILTCNHKNK